MTSPSEAMIRETYERIKRENPAMAEGVILDRVSRLLGIDRLRVGSVLREPVPFKRYSLICRHKNSPLGGN